MADNAHGNAANEDANDNDARGEANDNDAREEANENDARGNENDAGANEGLNFRDLNELQKFSNLMNSRHDAVTKCDETTAKMGSFARWRDCKVPDSERGFFNFVSLKTCTDKNNMSQSIEVYKKFYQELKGAADALRQAAREGNADADEILMLYSRLSQILEDAELNKKTTNSSTLYEIHKDFIASQEPLENMIRRVECVALRQQLRQVTKAWKDASHQITEMTVEMQGLREDNRDIRKRLDELAATNEQMAKNQQILMQQNEIMTNLLKNFFDRL